MEFSKDMSGFAVPNFVAHGIKVVVAGYDLCPNGKYLRIFDLKIIISLYIKYKSCLIFAS